MKTSLYDLADEALAAQQTGESHANLALDSETLSSDQMAAMKRAAIAGSERHQEMLAFVTEAKEAVFTDAFARASYFRGIIGQLAAEDTPEPNKVLSTFQSAISQTMHVRGCKQPQPAIPLFTALDDRAAAVKHYSSPFLIPDANRGKNGKGVDHIHSAKHKHVIPTTTLDVECFKQMEGLRRRMSAVMLSWLETTTEDLRQIVWLALHFFPGAYVLRAEDVEKRFSCTQGAYRSKDGRVLYPFFRLSASEFFMLPNSPEAQQLIAHLTQRRKA
jgi:hypothetical protein